MAWPRFWPKVGALLALALLLQVVLSAENEQMISATNEAGERVWLSDNRKPALYTGDFGDCLGASSVNITRFDAAYYKDNMTITFHLTGNTALNEESVMMYIGVYAYGESRLDLTFNPCSANIASMCPVKANTSIEASGIIPVSPSDVAAITPLALTIPDFEGEAILRIFSNSTESEIGCFSAIVTNGATFSHPAAVGTVLGIFTIVAVVASFATTVYGDHVPTMRRHYAHSLSVLVVFAVFHHIFYSGALSMNWPSALVAFWSNYAWAGGMIYTEAMQNSINSFIGSNNGNTTAVGSATAKSLNDELGGGYDVKAIYRRKLDVHYLAQRDLSSRSLEALAKRAIVNKTEGFTWYGEPIKPGLPLPGNFSGFAGTLAQERIPASNAFMTGFLWFLILCALVAATVVAFKWLLEALAGTGIMRKDRLSYFRSHWLGYTTLALLRTFLIAFFMMITLTLFQFTLKGSAGVTAIASIVFIIFFVGLFGIAAYACYYRLRSGKYVSKQEPIHLRRKRVLGFLPWYSFSRQSNDQTRLEKASAMSIPFWRMTRSDADASDSIHDDEDYTKQFGWLASRFRRTRWWFFAVWLLYEFIRACFYGAASQDAIGQVFGLLVLEFIAFIVIVVMRPFEGQRLNALVVYLLGFSKVATVALSAACDVRFNIARIPTTVIGIVIIVIQGILTVVLLIAIAVGACSSYMSIMRNREEFKPRKWISIRERYFSHMDKAAKDLPPPPPAPSVPEEPKEPYFSLSSVRRVAKIEDEDPEFMAEISGIPHINPSHASLDRLDGPSARRNSHAASLHSQMSHTSLPFGARVYRPSWSTRDLLELADRDRDRNSTPRPFGATDGADAWPLNSAASSSLRLNPSTETFQRTPSPRAVSGRPRTMSDATRAVSPLAGPPTRPRTASDGQRVQSPLAPPRMIRYPEGHSPMGGPGIQEEART